MKSVLLIILVLVALAVGGAAGAWIALARFAPAGPVVTDRCVWWGDIDRGRLDEPSGIVYHRDRGTLFVVGDDGYIAEMRPDGTRLQTRGRDERDYEGITVDPATGLVYVAVEGEEAIMEIDPDTLATLRQWSIGRTFQGHTVMAEGGNGIEGITFVPDASHAHGGTFYVAHQQETPPEERTVEQAEEVAGVFEVEVPLRDEGGAEPGVARIVRQLALDAADMAALAYDSGRDVLWVISDQTNTVYELALDGRVLSRRELPSESVDQEGLAIDDAGNWYLAQDTGGVVRFLWISKPLAGPRTSSESEMSNGQED